MEKIELGEDYGTLSQTMNALYQLGYKYDFNIHDECIVCQIENIVLPPEEFQIDKVYRFEGASDPDYQSVLYAISSKNHGLRGLLVNGYGISYDEMSSKVIERLKTHSSTE